MRFFLRAVTFASAILVSLAMLALNVGFELAGSVPDITGCGFLAGNLLALILLYPALCALISARMCRFIARREPIDIDSMVRFGGRIGGWGAAVYFIGGVFGVLAAPHATGVPALGWLAAALFTGAAWAGGRTGALEAANRILSESAVAAGETGR